MGIRDQITEQSEELKRKGSSFVDKHREKSKDWVKTHGEKTKSKLKEKKSELGDQYRESKANLRNQWLENRPQWMNYWDSASAHRNRFINDTPLASRMSGLAMLSGLTFLLSRGLVRRFKRAIYVGVIGGVFIVPEVMNPFKKK